MVLTMPVVLYMRKFFMKAWLVLLVVVPIAWAVFSWAFKSPEFELFSSQEQDLPSHRSKTPIQPTSLIPSSIGCEAVRTRRVLDDLSDEQFFGVRIYEVYDLKFEGSIIETKNIRANGTASTFELALLEADRDLADVRSTDLAIGDFKCSIIIN